MKHWRAALAILAGLLLPVPLVLLALGVMFPKPWSPESDGARVSPVLNVEERTRRVTYRRECQDSSECEKPLGCVSDGRVWADYCTDSQCMTDAQCSEGFVCRSVATAGAGPLVRFCITEGLRQEGERCDPLPSDKDEACAPGLLCGGREGWCGRPCQRDSAGCPEGFFCADVAPQPLCLPTCVSRGCPEGQRCVGFEEGASACAEVLGPDCQQSPCAGGSECRVLSATHPGKVWMECVQPCGEGRPECPAGNICYLWRCQPSCDPQKPGTCGEGFRCERAKPESPPVCWPDW
jgi:hypothetical protein